jgi:hypothetical protein
MATFVMQALGCEVSALNTVHFSTLFPLLDLYLSFWLYFLYHCRVTVLPTLTCPHCPLHALNLCSMLYYTNQSCPGNHTGYGQFKGTRASAQEIRDIYDGLCQSHLTDFDMLLSGYLPSAETVEAVGVIARDLRLKANNKPGSFFWGVYLSAFPPPQIELSPPFTFAELKHTPHTPQSSIPSWATKAGST